MKRNPRDEERADGIYRTCKGCGEAKRVSDYPTRAFGLPEPYCGTCRRTYQDRIVAERIGASLKDWIAARRRSGQPVDPDAVQRVLIVGRRKDG